MKYCNIIGSDKIAKEFLKNINCNLDILMEKSETVLEMFPNNLHCDILLVSNKEEVNALYYKQYGLKVDYIAYSRLGSKQIIISVEDANKNVLAHEFGHIIISWYFTERPPSLIHELIAQYCEKNILG